MVSVSTNRMSLISKKPAGQSTGKFTETCIERSLYIFAVLSPG